MRRNIHFFNNSKIKQKFVRGYNPLSKVNYPLEIIIKVIRGVWTSVKHVYINKSMIKYMGRAVTYVQ